MCLYSCEMYVFWVFFFKQKTAYEMRMSDWSSDVCSSDLQGLAYEGVVAAGFHAHALVDLGPVAEALGQAQPAGGDHADRGGAVLGVGLQPIAGTQLPLDLGVGSADRLHLVFQIGRATCRQRV